jgi:S-methylmethionine-dependent homocysteine/selenocysteine methylase
MSVTILDGPMGTELRKRGVPTPTPEWSAHGLVTAPDVVAEIHAAYAAAGATVHTANTFRTRRRTFPQDWATLARRAVRIARGAVPAHHRVAGSLAPLEDCYSPWLSPADPIPEHRELAEVLAEAGCDLLLCETFPHVGEGLAAVQTAVATGLETWAAFTAGPDGRLLSPSQVRDAAARAADLGASTVFVNCVPARLTAAYCAVLGGLGVPFGAYANAGHADEGMGWVSAPTAPERYADLAQVWVDHGATVLGSCCGTGPAVVAELARRFG